ncbi:MAG TPA: hypothetical protein VL137_08270 [Polyangiaceae bacterium]|nr:hypothetical protein [Polyangiaceae bacterium]
MTQNNLSVRRRALGTLALGGLLVGSLMIACSKEQKDPDISNTNTGNNNGGTTSNTGGTASNNGGTGGSTGGTATTGGAGGAAGGACAVPHQVVNRMTQMCACPGSLPDECPTTGCVSLMTDPANCGTCGNACDAGADCNAGTCTMAPSAVATLTGCTAQDPTAAARPSPRMILANGVFYITDPGKGTVSSLPVAGGTPTSIAANQMEPDSLAVDATSVYWANRGDNTIHKAPLAGGADTTLLTLDAPSSDFAGADPNPPTMIAVSGNLIYFTHKADIFSIPTTGVAAGDAGAGTAPTLPDMAHCMSLPNYDANQVPTVPGPAVPGATYITGSNASCFKGGYPRAVAANGTNIIYTVKLREAVEANVLDGSMFLKLGASQPSLVHDFVELNDTAGYWARESHVYRAFLNAQGVGAMGAVANEPVVTTSGFDNITAMTLTATHAYIAGEDGHIVRGALAAMPLAMGASPPPAEAVLRDQKGAAWLTHDATNLYWLNPDCSINTVPLPQ